MTASDVVYRRRVVLIPRRVFSLFLRKEVGSTSKIMQATFCDVCFVC